MNTNPSFMKSAFRDKRDNPNTKSGHSYHKNIHKYKPLCEKVKEDKMGFHGCPYDIYYSGNMLFFPDYLYEFLI